MFINVKSLVNNLTYTIISCGRAFTGCPRVVRTGVTRRTSICGLVVSCLARDTRYQGCVRVRSCRAWIWGRNKSWVVSYSCLGEDL